MKKIVIIFVVLLSVIGLYFLGEQVYYYRKFDNNNFRMILSNYTERDSVNVKVLIDNHIEYGSYILNSQAFNGFSRDISIGNHELELIIDGKTLHKEKFFIFLNRIYLVECGENERLGVYTSSRYLMIQ